MTRKIAAVLVALALTATLGGSAVASGQPATVKHAQAASQPQYLATMRALDLGPVIGAQDNRGLITGAERFCATGADFTDLNEADVDQVQALYGLNPQQVRRIYTVMAAFYCPQNL